MARQWRRRALVERGGAGVNAIYYTRAPVAGTHTLDPLRLLHTGYSLEGRQADLSDGANTDVTDSMGNSDGRAGMVNARASWSYSVLP